MDTYNRGTAARELIVEAPSPLEKNNYELDDANEP
jgi:hypothetical protein